MIRRHIIEQTNEGLVIFDSSIPLDPQKKTKPKAKKGKAKRHKRSSETDHFPGPSSIPEPDIGKNWNFQILKDSCGNWTQ